MKRSLVAIAAGLFLLVTGAHAQNTDLSYAPPLPDIAPDPLLIAGENPCPEGQYRDYSVSTEEIFCRDLLRDTGFDQDAFDAALPDFVIDLQHCDWDSLAVALIAIDENGGGTLRLPACTIEASRTSISLPDNLVIEGAGMGQSIIEEPRFRLNMFGLRGQNVIMRDLTLAKGVNPFLILYSRNVLIERVEARDSKLNGLSFGYSRNVTVRYSYIHNTEQNGVLSKDCFPGSIKLWLCGDTEDPGYEACADSVIITQALCEEAITFVADSVHKNPIEPGSIWTTDYAVYSNMLHHSVTSHGAALHARSGEIAGNWFFENRRGIKLPDSEDVWMHHNLFDTNDQFAVHIYAVIQDHPPTNSRIFANQIHNNGDFAMRLEGVRMVMLINNHYSGNFACYDGAVTSWCDNPEFRNNDALRLSHIDLGGVRITPEVFACPAFQDYRLKIAGHWSLGLLPDEFCTLTVANEDESPQPKNGLLQLYPNPASGSVHLSYHPSGAGTVVIDLYDTLGRRVHRIHEGTHSGRNRLDVSADLSSLPPGTYFARITEHGRIMTAPVVVSRR